MGVRRRCVSGLDEYGRGWGGAGPAVYAAALVEDICFTRPHRAAGAGGVVGSVAVAVLGFVRVLPVCAPFFLFGYSCVYLVNGRPTRST